MSKGSLYSIGYSGFANNVEGFIDMLNRYRINVLIDVRSSPYSAYFSEFNKDNLERVLKENGIYYRNYAAEFGARQEERKLYPEGYLSFELFSKTDAFREGMQKVITGTNAGYSMAFMCAEKEPVTCHRAILVARAFYEDGYPVTHILPNGDTKTQTDIEDELLQMNPPTLFDDSEIDSLVLAYRKQNEKIGFKLEDLK